MTNSHIGCASPLKNLLTNHIKSSILIHSRFAKGLALSFLLSSFAPLTSCSGTDKKTTATVSPKNTTVSTYAGFADEGKGFRDGNALTAKFYFPTNIAFDKIGNLFVADCGNHCIRKITPSGMVSTFAGVPQQYGYKDGDAKSALFSSPSDLVFDGAGNLIVSDMQNNTLRKVSPDGIVSTIAGIPSTQDIKDGVGTQATFRLPAEIEIDSKGNIYVLESSALRKVTPSGVVSTVAIRPDGNETLQKIPHQFEWKSITSLTMDENDNLFFVDISRYAIQQLSPTGQLSTYFDLRSQPEPKGDRTIKEELPLRSPYAMVFDADHNVYVGDADFNCIYRITPGKKCSRIAGDRDYPDRPRKGTGATTISGNGDVATFKMLTGITIDAKGSLYAADRTNGLIRKISFN